jgi:hypothetical protein
MLFIDYKLGNQFRWPTDALAIATADEMDLRYSFFLGNIHFKYECNDFSANWEWIPILDFAASMKYICKELSLGKELMQFDFTESAAAMVFELFHDELRITTNYAEGRIVIPFKEFCEVIDLFWLKVVRECGEGFPALKQNNAFHKLFSLA